MEHLCSWHCLGVRCLLCRSSPRLKQPPLWLWARLHLQKQSEEAICTLSSKHPGAAGPRGLRRREDERHGRGTTKPKINPCIVEFGFPTTRPRYMKKDPASLVGLPLLSCQQWLDHQMSALSRKLKCSLEKTRWEKERRLKCQGGEVQRDVEELIARPGHPWGGDDAQASLVKF